MRVISHKAVATFSRAHPEACAARSLVSHDAAGRVEEPGGNAADVSARRSGGPTDGLQYWRRKIPAHRPREPPHAKGLHSSGYDARRIRQGRMGGMNALPAIDEKKYGRVLSRELPRPIRRERELTSA